jgi:hypothetical protein
MILLSKQVKQRQPVFQYKNWLKGALNLKEYNIKVVITEKEVPLKDMKKRVTDFQSVFAVVASRYYNYRNMDENLFL